MYLTRIRLFLLKCYIRLIKLVNKHGSRSVPIILSKSSVINILPVFEHERYCDLPNYESEIIPHLVIHSRIIAKQILLYILTVLTEERAQKHIEDLQNVLDILVTLTQIPLISDGVTINDFRIIYHIFIENEFYDMISIKLSELLARLQVNYVEIKYPKFNYNDLEFLQDDEKLGGIILLLRKTNQTQLVEDFMIFLYNFHQKNYPNDLDHFLYQNYKYKLFLNKLLTQINKIYTE